MYICISANESECGIGNTLKEAHNAFVENTGDDESPEDLSFYEIGPVIPVEVQIVPKEVLVPKKEVKK